jgi:hypothetical protein
MVALSSLAGAGWQFFGNNGLPLAGGKLYTYAAGTTTPLAAYTSISGATPHANPIVLDSAGRVPSEVWLTSTANYKFTLKTAADVEIWTKDNVPGIAASTDLALYVTYTDLASTAAGKGAELVGFSGFNGAANVDEALDWLRTSVSVIEFGAVGDGTTDDRTAIQAAIDYAYANGMDVAFPADIPAYYKVSLNLVCRPGVSMRGVGGQAKIKNMNTGGATLMDRSVFLPGNMLLNYTQILTSYDCGTVDAGNSVTLTTPADVLNFAVGDQVVTLSTATSVSSGFTLNDYLHLNRITGISGATITLQYPIDISYAGGIALLSSVSTTAAPIVLPMYFIDNCSFENLDVEAPGGGMFSGYGGMYNVTVRDCIVDGQWGPYVNAAQYCTFTNNKWYFSYLMGDFSLNSLYSVIDDDTFLYKYNSTVTPVARFQFSEAARHCKFINSSVNTNRLTVLAGNSLFAFGSATRCVVARNNIANDSSASSLTTVSFGGRTAGIRCFRNTFADNVVQMNNVRMFVYFSVTNFTVSPPVPATDVLNINNRVENNLFTANSGDFAYSVRLDSSYSNYVSNNKSTFGAIFFNDTASSGNIIENNYFPQGFSTNETDLADNYYQQNVLRNNASAASVVKQSLALASASSVNAPASTATTVYTDNIGTNMATRDRYEFEFYIQPTGVANTKPIVFNLRNVTDASDIALFSHTIPAASTGLVVVKTTVVVKGAGAAAATTTTVYDTTAGTTTTYASTFTRPAVDKDLSFNFIATPGAGVSLSFVQISANYSNPYN